MTLWLIGAGPMAQDYAKVLHALQQSFSIIGRGQTSADRFQQATGQPVITGGLSQVLKTQAAPEAAIVAVGVEQLAPTASTLIQSGTRRILLEKPGGLDLAEIEALHRLAVAHGAEVLLAYNRRFYASTLKAQGLIAEDGGPVSAQFEFTEWSHKIGPIAKASGVKERWLLGNSSHVIDLAFYLCGRPADWRHWHAGMLDWHPAAARFCGAGVTTRGVLFAYLADWQAPGRWGLELLTRQRRLILRPMEQLHVTHLGTVSIEPVTLNDSLDHDFKPGLYRQTQAFLCGDHQALCPLAEQVEHVRLYSAMAGYR